MKPSESLFVELRGRRMHVRAWGSADAPLLFMVHGWGDTSASFQFIVDHLDLEWRVLALDWRGFGQSQWNEDTYWYPDYFADLDAMLDRFSPETPVRLLGHSMGGTVASIYTGVRDGRVERFINLEGGGLRSPAPDDGPHRVRRWLDQIRHGMAFRVYPDRAAYAERLMQDNRRLSPERAAFLALHQAEDCEGGVRFAGDPRHLWTNPVYYSSEEMKASWRLVKADVLWIAARDSFVMKAFDGREQEYRSRLACFARLREEILEDSGHNMHHDQPARVARLVEDFLS